MTGNQDHGTTNAQSFIAAPAQGASRLVQYHSFTVITQGCLSNFQTFSPERFAGVFTVLGSEPDFKLSPAIRVVYNTKLKLKRYDRLRAALGVLNEGVE